MFLTHEKCNNHLQPNLLTNQIFQFTMSSFSKTFICCLTMQNTITIYYHYFLITPLNITHTSHN